MVAWIKYSVVALALLIAPPLAWSQEKAGDAKAAKEDSPELKLADGKILLTKPESWKRVPPGMMVVHEFRAPGEAEKDKSARVTIMGATGGIEQNVARWIGQFEGLKKEDAKIEKKTVDKTTVHIIELEGTFKGMPGAGAKKMDGYAMIGVILELKDGTTEFIKMTGPKEVVAKEKDGFVKMLNELKNK